MVVLTLIKVRTTKFFYVLIRKICGAFHANGRPHSLTLRYRVPSFFNHQVRVELKLFLVTFSLEKK